MKKRGELNRYINELTMTAGRLANRSLQMNGADSGLDDAIIEYAMCDERDYSTTIPFWLQEQGSKNKPCIFLGRLSRRARKKRSRM